MNKVFRSAVLTLAAVPFLMAAPKAAKNAQNQPQAASQTQSAAKPKSHKKHMKKNQKDAAGAQSNVAAPQSSSPAK
ncbi:MAG: hypothetical protein JOZ62_12250 [Acidobacteriaceae bacterium]|nr:hypothetical protein [Acidobacteriaceae bacterium]